MFLKQFNKKFVTRTNHVNTKTSSVKSLSILFPYKTKMTR